MPIASSPSTSKRLLAMLSLLQSRRDWPASVLAERLDVSERTVRRDIERLRELDYTIDATRGPDGGYRLEAGSALPPLLFDDEQVVALALALRTAGSLGAGMEEAAERALHTVTRLMPSRLSHRVSSLTEAVAAGPRDATVEVDADVLLRIGEAIREERELRFDYDSPTPTDTVPAVRTTQPHHLLLHRGRWYLIGYSSDRDDWRIYRVDRITPRTHTGRAFVPRGVPGGDPARFLAARFKGSHQEDTWPCWGEATLDVPLSTVAPYLGESSGVVIDEASCRIRLGAWSWEAVATGFCRLGAALSNAEPAEVRDAFAVIAERAAAASSPTNG